MNDRRDSERCDNTLIQKILQTFLRFGNHWIKKGSQNTLENILNECSLSYLSHHQCTSRVSLDHNTAAYIAYNLKIDKSTYPH